MLQAVVDSGGVLLVFGLELVLARLSVTARKYDSYELIVFTVLLKSLSRLMVSQNTVSSKRTS